MMVSEVWCVGKASELQFCLSPMFLRDRKGHFQHLSIGSDHRRFKRSCIFDSIRLPCSSLFATPLAPVPPAPMACHPKRYPSAPRRERVHMVLLGPHLHPIPDVIVSPVQSTYFWDTSHSWMVYINDGNSFRLENLLSSLMWLTAHFHVSSHTYAQSAALR